MLAVIALTAIVAPVLAQITRRCLGRASTAPTISSPARRTSSAVSTIPGAGELAAAIRLQADARTEFGASRFAPRAGPHPAGASRTPTRRSRWCPVCRIRIGVLAQLERTRELLDRARERIEECNLDRARAMLRVALEMQARAEALGPGWALPRRAPVDDERPRARAPRVADVQPRGQPARRGGTCPAAHR